jgi:hypothetical protein
VKQVVDEKKDFEIAPLGPTLALAEILRLLQKIGLQTIEH